MDLMNRCGQTGQKGHTLVQSMMGMVLSSWVITAAFTVYAWVNSNHQHLQAIAEMHEQLHTALLLVQERVARAGAPLVQFDAQSKASLLKLSTSLQGSDSNLTLTHHSRLTPSDCQGHQASALDWIQDDFKLSTRNELSCKDKLRSNTSYQALVDDITQVSVLYAQALPGPVPLMQWRTANQVSDWQAIRGVQVCVQTKLAQAITYPSTRPCHSGLASKPPFLAWRGVAYLQHASP